MCRTSIFTCIVAMSSSFLIIYTFREIFLRFFFHKYNILLHLDVILILLLLTVTFFSFHKQLYFFACCFEDSHNCFIQSFLQNKVCLFSMWSNAQTVEIATRICSPIFVVFWIIWTSIYFFNSKIQCQHK